MRVLVVGAGVAGPTLAYWLLRTGHEPTLVERAPRLREGGYVVDFWGAGFDVAERMGIVPRLREEGYRFREAREVSSSGRRIAHLDPMRVIEGAAAGRYVTVGRSDLARAICDAMDGAAETIFAPMGPWKKLSLWSPPARSRLKTPTSTTYPRIPTTPNLSAYCATRS